MLVFLMTVGVLLLIALERKVSDMALTIADLAAAMTDLKATDDRVELLLTTIHQELTDALAASDQTVAIQGVLDQIAAEKAALSAAADANPDPKA